MEIPYIQIHHASAHNQIPTCYHFDTCIQNEQNTSDNDLVAHHHNQGRKCKHTNGGLVPSSCSISSV